MRRIILSIMAGALFLGTTTAAFGAGEIQRRQERQQKRIAGGVGNGSLTAGETARIEHQEHRLNREIRHDRKDGGGLTNQEKVKINRQQNRVSKEIYKQKHDGQTQP